jgi:tellurite resistance protein
MPPLALEIAAMALSTHDALVTLMIVSAWSDTEMSQQELDRIGLIVTNLPIFAGFDRSRLEAVANKTADAINGPDGLDGVIEAAIAALPERLHDTAYALAVEIAAVDLRLEQEELRYLEMVRDHLASDRLTTAAIEAAARARYRRAS